MVQEVNCFSQFYQIMLILENLQKKTSQKAHKKSLISARINTGELS